MCFLTKLGRHVRHGERMNPNDFGGQRSKVKVTMDIYGNELVNMIKTKPLCISLSYLADMLRMMRGWTLMILEGQKSRSQWTLCISLSNLADMLTMVNPIDLEVTVQRWRSRWVSLTYVGCAGMLRFALLYFFLLTSIIGWFVLFISVSLQVR